MFRILGTIGLGIYASSCGFNIFNKDMSLNPTGIWVLIGIETVWYLITWLFNDLYLTPPKNNEGK